MITPSVVVLMSTYNGEKYIREQIDSILNQKSVNLQLLIRDDGSQDKTNIIISEYIKQYDNIKYISGSNIGVGRSFIQLLIDAPEADYYAYADQDDVWLPEKISRAIELINKTEKTLIDKPVLYTSNQILVDSNLNRIGMRFQQEPMHDILHVISKNDLSGCTMVIPNNLRKIIISKIPSDKSLSLRLHDTWTVIVAELCGKTIYDKESYIFYRQHGGNVVGGIKKNYIQNIEDKIRRLHTQKYRGTRSRIALEILDLFSDYMDDNLRQRIEKIEKANSLANIFLILQDPVLLSAFPENAVLLLLKGLFGWI